MCKSSAEHVKVIFEQAQSMRSIVLLGECEYAAYQLILQRDEWLNKFKKLMKNHITKLKHRIMEGSFIVKSYWSLFLQAIFGSSYRPKNHQMPQYLTNKLKKKKNSK